MDGKNSGLKWAGRVKESAFLTAATNIIDSEVTLEIQKEGKHSGVCRFNSSSEHV